MKTMKLVIARMTCVTILGTAFPLIAGTLDNAWIKGTTDKNPLSYKPGEEMVFTLEPQGIEGDLPEGVYKLWWKRSDDYGEFFAAVRDVAQAKQTREYGLDKANQRCR